MDKEFVNLLRCPRCRDGLSVITDGATADSLVCRTCGNHTEVRNGVPRFVPNGHDGGAATDVSERTRASFGYEWSHFNDWRPWGTEIFSDYFSHFDLESLKGRTVLDGGCGMGRHARQVAPFAERVVAVDFSSAIDEAARNVRDRPNVHCVQADLMCLPLADEAFDFVYSMGVLHHLEGTSAALRGLTRTLKPGGRLRVYLYWKREGFVGVLLSVVTFARKLTTRLPFGILRTISWLLSLVLFATVIVPYRLFIKFGARLDAWPLVVYAKYPFNALYNDQFDRLSAPLEKRYSEAEVYALLQEAGLRDIKIHQRFGWIGEGVK